MKVVLRPVYLQILLVLVCLSNASGLSAQALKVGEVYDYNVGDEFIFQSYVSTGPPTYSNRKVVARTDYSSDSVNYTFEVMQYNLNINTKLWESTKWIISKTYVDLNALYFEDFLQKDSISYDTINSSKFLKYELKDSLITDSCGTLFNYRSQISGSPLSGSVKKIYKAIKGVGVLEYYEMYGSSPSSYHYDNLLYYKKASVVCGSEKSLPTNIKAVSKKSAVKIWPNPAKDWLNIGGEPLFGFKIFDVTGREVLSALIADENPIDISSLRRGLYTIVVVTAIKGTITFKLTVVE